MIKYMIRLSTDVRITPVEVERETEHCVWIRGRKNNKVSSYENYYDTWDAAHAGLLEYAEGRLNAARSRLAGEQGFYGNVKGLRKPEPQQ